MLYISEFVEIKKQENCTSVYAPTQNSIILVSDGLLKILRSLRDKYLNDPIDEKDEVLKELQESECFELLLKHRIFTDDPVGFENIYRNFNSPLTEVYFHVTQECNLRCTYCYAQHNLGKNMMMDIQHATAYIDQIDSMSCKKYVLTGGEPLLNKDIGLINAYIRSKQGTHVTLLTNGTLIKKHQELLREVDEVIISLDVVGSDNRRGVSLNEVMANIGNLPSDIKKKVAVRSVISRGEEELLEPMKEKIIAIGAEHISIPRLPNCPEDLELFPDVKRISFSEDYVKKYGMTKCGAATSVIAVDWNGDVYPCQNLMKEEHLISNLNISGWLEILEKSALVNEIKNAHILEIEKCKECFFRFACGGGCRALSYNVYGCYDHCLDFFCDHYKQTSMKKLSAVTFRMEAVISN